MKTITIEDFSLDIHPGNIGVAVSGGADSTLMLYMLMKHVTQPIHVISCGNGMTNDQEPVNALKIVNAVKKLTGKNNVYFTSHWSENKQLGTAFPKELLSKLDIDVLYLGFTRPPPDGAITDFNITNSAAVGGVDKGLIRQTFWSKDDDLVQVFGPKVEGISLGVAICSPFININKKEIAKLYKSLDIEALYSMTRSCESLTALDVHCGECWWCKERMWAFGKLV